MSVGGIGSQASAGGTDSIGTDSIDAVRGDGGIQGAAGGAVDDTPAPAQERDRLPSVRVQADALRAALDARLAEAEGAGEVAPVTAGRDAATLRADIDALRATSAGAARNATARALMDDLVRHPDRLERRALSVRLGMVLGGPAVDAIFDGARAPHVGQVGTFVKAGAEAANAVLEEGRNGREVLMAGLAREGAHVNRDEQYALWSSVNDLALGLIGVGELAREVSGADGAWVTDAESQQMYDRLQRALNLGGTGGPKPEGLQSVLYALDHQGKLDAVLAEIADHGDLAGRLAAMIERHAPQFANRLPG